MPHWGGESGEEGWAQKASEGRDLPRGVPACSPPGAGVTFGCVISPNPPTHPRGRRGVERSDLATQLPCYPPPEGSGASVST